jgi:prolyl oligopeptidase
MLALLGACLPLAALAAPPAALVRPVTTDYYGTRVVDDYRWMEAPDSRRLAAWMRAQNAYTRSVLDAIPGRAALLRDIDAASNSTTQTGSLIRAGGRDFYLQTAPGQNTAKLYVRDEATHTSRLLVDPDRFGSAGTAEAINYFQPSQDGHYVAYGVSAGGSEAATLRVIDTASGRDTGVAIDRCWGDNDEFQPVWWLPDGKSFVYYRLQKLSASDPASAFFLKSRVYLHHLGANPHGGADVALFGYAVNPGVPVAPDEDAMIATVPGSPFAFGVLTRNETSTVIDAIYVSPLAAVQAGRPQWRQLAGRRDDISGFTARGARAYLLTYRNAPRFRLIATDLAAPDLAHATVVVPESRAVINTMGVASDALYVQSTLDGMSRITRIPWGGTASELSLPYSGTARDLATDPHSPGALFVLESWIRPPAVYAYDARTGQLHDTGIQPPSSANTSGLVSREVQAVSYDGTLIPLSIIMGAGTRLDGHNPTLLIGYGSYGITLSPRFVVRDLPWLRRGGILAVAHVRGGGWFGEGWHEAGMKLSKLNTVFDMIACAQYLIDQGYTSAHDLGGSGTSAGGITIGGAIDWRPDLFAAAIDSHGMSDTLRSELTPNGPPNVVEFGSVRTRAGFHGLYAMSPYVHVRDGVHYPAVLLETGVNDPRVEPWEVAKMTARLQAANGGPNPVLLRVSYDSGHGIGSTKAQENREQADEESFLLWRFGVPGFQPTAPTP